MTTSFDSGGASDAKAMAKRLRAALDDKGFALTHSEALEIVARQHGERDWNTFVARNPTRPDLLPAVPILRIFDQAKAYEFYTGFLGFTVDWEHRFGDHMPLYAQVSRGAAVIHLSEHHGDASPGGAVIIRVADVVALHAELTAHDYPAARPGIDDEEWGRTVTVLDPFSNRITFHEPIQRDRPDQPDAAVAHPNERGHVAAAAAPIVVQIEVDSSPEHAFWVFTARMGEWWDPDYSPDPHTFTGIDLEPHRGGTVAMMHGGEGRYEWGTVTEWEPGRRYAQTFTLAHDPDYPSEISADFEAAGTGCAIRFAHGGWTAGNVAARSRFQDWPHLLGRFAALAER